MDWRTLPLPEPNRERRCPMRTSSVLAIALASCLVACDGHDATQAEAVSPPAAHEAANPSPAAQPAPQPDEEKPLVNKDCHGVRLTLSALDTADAESTSTQVELTHNGKSRHIDTPEDMRDYTAVGLGCTQDSSGTPYFVVQFGELPYGCEFCEWFFLYDANGRPLNRSQPPITTEAGGQAPNNVEYQELLHRLGLQHPEIDYFPP